MGVSLCTPSQAKSCTGILTNLVAVGERFELRSEQELLDAVLVDTETKHGWPTRIFRAQLRQAWGW